MAFFIGAVAAVLLICLLFIIRLYIVVKTGSNHKPGSKGPVAALVVAGSGNANVSEHGRLALLCFCCVSVLSCNNADITSHNII